MICALCLYNRATEGSKPLKKRVTLGHVIASRVTKHHYVIIVSGDPMAGVEMRRF